ncbi:MAG: hypothetical protein VYA54_02325 [Bdellovibrionota bacterium]|mgnify:FL=1|nr:hypothetical protein [Bdellovibrionota bacterium]
MSDKNEKESLADILKKVVNTGVSAAFMTEDAIKNMVGDLPLPKELVQGLINNAKSTRDDFITSVKTELKERLERIDVSKEIDRILENYDVEVNAKIKFSPKKKKNSSPKK